MTGAAYGNSCLRRLLTGFAIFGLSAFATSQDARADYHEEILSFASRIIVHADSSLTVTETIKVRATGDQIKRGIYRDFPTTAKDSLGIVKKVGFRVEDVTRDGRALSHWLACA